MIEYCCILRFALYLVKLLNIKHINILSQLCICMEIEIILFEGFDELDAIAPYEVFQLAGQYTDINTKLVTIESTDHVKARSGMNVVPDGPISNTQDVLLVPGGGWNEINGPGVRREYERNIIPQAIAKRFRAGTIIISVCTGSLMLAKAGILENRPVATHHTAHNDLCDMGLDVREDRFVDDGQILTASGITSGLDLALYFVERECGVGIADSISQQLEYERVSHQPK